ncbi:L-fuculose-phosphate aldolase [Thaumasiovibrio sp. DFM-14]|uniref:L-fuculose-phosphate aldolase n=1 Tax=Thaumasiovibrio sp. DFM-14 TaxID=3384792 RepID=UPI00399F8726
MSREHLAQKIIDTCLKMTELGLNQGTAGNVSARYKEGMLITPTGIAYDQMTPEHIVYVDDQGNFEEGKIPSSEWRFHQVVYQTRDDLHAVVHNHSLNCAGVSILNKAIPAIHYMVAVGGGHQIPCVPYATFGTPELADNVASVMVDYKATLLQHHGLIAGEVNLDKALWLAHEVEVLAELYLKLLPTGEVPVLPSDEIDRVLEKFKSYGLRVE